MKEQRPWTVGNRVIGYDPERRRLWVGGQRVHHGVTGLALAVGGLAQLARHRLPLRRSLTWTLAGGAMVAHDWHDRAVWFRRGSQTD